MSEQLTALSFQRSSSTSNNVSDVVNVDILYGTVELTFSKWNVSIVEDKATLPRTVGGGRETARGCTHPSSRAYPHPN